MDLSIIFEFFLITSLLYPEISGTDFVSADGTTILPSRTSNLNETVKTTNHPGPATAAMGYAVQKSDIIFLLDGSYSVGKHNFELLKNWVSTVSSEFDIKSGAVKIGVIQYSHWYSSLDLDKQPYMVTEVALGQYTSHEQLTTAINDITLHSYTTYTAHAINRTILDFEASSRWESNTTQKVLILITDGSATDHGELPGTAEYVRSLGITTFAVGVKAYVVDELRTIATGNLTSNERVCTVSDFDVLSGCMESLRSIILKQVATETTTRQKTETTTGNSPPLPSSSPVHTEQTTASTAYYQSTLPPLTTISMTSGPVYSTTTTTTSDCRPNPANRCTARYKELLRQYEEILKDYKESYSKWKAAAKTSGILCNP